VNPCPKGQFWGSEFHYFINNLFGIFRNHKEPLFSGEVFMSSVGFCITLLFMLQFPPGTLVVPCQYHFTSVCIHISLIHHRTDIGVTINNIMRLHVNN
jgi:hypothetical protein